jgi:Tfp pilus assembly protein PilZ
MWLGRNLAVSLVNASEGGLSLVVSEALVKGEMVTMIVEALGHLRPVKLIGKIAWCRPASEGQFRIGVELEKGLSGRDLMQLT